MLNYYYISGMGLTWSLYVIFMCSCIYFTSILLDSFVPMVNRESGLEFSFVVPLSSFDTRVILGSQKLFRCAPPFPILWKSMRSTGVSSPLKVWEYSVVNPSGPELWFWKLKMVSILLLVMDLFMLFVSSWFNFFSGNVPLGLHRLL